MWRFIHTGSRSPAENMAIDEAILTAHQEGLVPPTVRFYGWNPGTLSIGYFQQADKEIDFEALRGYGLGFVRRATGGRAVLHDQELTYSIVVSEHYPGIPASVAEAYRVLSMGLLFGFRKLGLAAKMTGLDEEAPPQAESSLQRAALSAACFDAPSKYELVVEGRKIAGSAQMRAKGVILQHGSILLELDTDKLFAVLRFADPEAKARMQRVFGRKAAAINACLRQKGGQPATMEMLENAFRAGFEEGLGAELAASELTAYELALAERLAREKYAADSWNLRR
ncbi:biotin/lipoate A/B protein ligase family protein [Paenibacillus sp. R14(2021)]|uniref:lipoate--protein ligase family protein n=1 Tax=Paenibacillus sp. R14(2021) TaxID=2859228 RepID=UPI001C613062|nr:biotin/lipoate A/B protein ligase family protein [Paenibacillus sp. R14(2021)]